MNQNFEDWLSNLAELTTIIVGWHYLIKAKAKYFIPFLVFASLIISYPNETKQLAYASGGIFMQSAKIRHRKQLYKIETHLCRIENYWTVLSGYKVCHGYQLLDMRLKSDSPYNPVWE